MDFPVNSRSDKKPEALADHLQRRRDTRTLPLSQWGSMGQRQRQRQRQRPLTRPCPPAAGCGWLRVMLRVDLGHRLLDHP